MAVEVTQGCLNVRRPTLTEDKSIVNLLSPLSRTLQLLKVTINLKR